MSFFNDPSKIDPNGKYSIAKLTDFIRRGQDGHGVREAIAMGIDNIDLETGSNIKDISDFTKDTERRQSDLEERWDNVIRETTDKDPISAPELIEARNGQPNLKTRLDSEHEKVTTQLAQTATKKELNQVDNKLKNIVNGSPKGVYETLIDLENAHPSGDEAIYVVSEDGFWYFWNGFNWEGGGVYQATISDEFPATNIATNGNFDNGTTGWTHAAGSLSAENNELVYTVLGLGTNARIERPVDDIVAGHKYYIKGEILPKYNNITYFEVGGVNSFGKPVIPNEWNYKSEIITASSNSRFRFYHRTHADYVVGDIIKFRNIVVIDLTKTFGVGNEPTINDMDSILSNYKDSYFEGTVSPLLSTKNIYLDFMSFLTDENEEWSV